MNQPSSSASQISRRGILVGYFLTLGVMACFAAILIRFAGWVFPQWDSRGMIWVGVLAALESILSFLAILRLPTAQRQLAFFRITEWTIILVLLKVFTEIRGGPAHLLANIRQWSTDFPLHLLSGEFLLNLCIVFITWTFSALLASDLHLLEVDEAVRFDEAIKTTPIRNRILRRLIGLACVALILCGIMFQKVSQVYLPAPENGQMVWLVILFFTLGLALLSLTRYASLLSTWQQAGMRVPNQISRRWAIYSLGVIVFLVALAASLPTRNGLGLYQTISAVYNFLAAVFSYFFALIIFLVTSLVRMVTQSSAPSQEVTPVPLATPPPAPLPDSNASSNVNLIGSIIFWIVVIGAAIFLLRQYVLYNQELSKDLKGFNPLRWLAGLWRRMLASIRNANRKIGAFFQERIQQMRAARINPTGSGDWSYLSLRKLSPRQKILFYYLALIKRADEAHLARRTDQTPYEYATSLNADLPDGQADIQAITNAFMEARYSRHEIPAEQVRKTRSAWEILRGVFQKTRRASERQRTEDQS